MNNPIVYDIEIAPNRTIIGFLECSTGKTILIDITGKPSTEDVALIRRIGEESDPLVGFNNLGFDTYLLDHVLNGLASSYVYDLGREIIESSDPSWKAARNMGANVSPFDEIDLMHYSPRAGLKVHEARMQMGAVENLPFEPGADITNDMMEMVCAYLRHDLAATHRLMQEVEEEIAIRQSLRDLFSIPILMRKPPAGVAEAVLLAEYSRRADVDQSAIRSTAAQFRDCDIELRIEKWVKDVCTGTRAGALIGQIEGVVFKYRDGLRAGPYPALPDGLIIPDSPYAFGVGGIHSVDASGVETGKACSLRDIDVGSYYPRLMLMPGGSPAHLDEAIFREVFGGILERRLEAKAAGRKRESNGLKLILNSTFGKMGEPFSALFSPPSFLATTLGGQLSLMALAEKIGAN